MSSIKYIVASVSGVHPSDAILDYAAWIAKVSQKSLKIFHILDHQNAEQETDLSGKLSPSVRADLLKEIVEIEHAQNKLMQRKAKLILDKYKARAEEQGVQNSELCLKHGKMIENLLDLEENVSLLVIGKIGKNHHEKEIKKPIGHKVEAVVRSLQKPVLVINEDFKIPKKALLAFDGSKSSQKALDYVLANSLFKDLQIHLVYAGAELSKSITFMNDALKKLETAGLQASSHFIDAKVETSIQDYATENDIDLLVMGAFGHHWVHEMVMGSFTRQMLASSSRPLLLVR